ncbi:hypothetical protein C8A01DRAFT_50464 [Parachaetomium inaequale]|uniref:Uncharacterized protein n=1 Tax=Parachaetomium inaequale TaxID=2588326 RepID=A0AAN6SMJ8_9PEZI|nr:hypothetical protein C8A01DRAFT_50464 [Parachaetomium inaequale]
MAPDADNADEPGPEVPELAKATHEHHGSSSALENLPAELRDQILLSAPDLLTLRSLVHASPVLHAQYRTNRDALLRACVARELDGFFVDAHACLMSRAVALGSIRTNVRITDFLDGYRGQLSGSRPRADVHSVNKPGSIRWLAAFHRTVARPLAHRYSTWALANLTQASSSSSEDQKAAETAASEMDIALSRSEEIRIFRALYRYETYYHLFGLNQATRVGIIEMPDINNLFFGLFDPWESEAIACLDVWVRQEYERLFDQVQDDLSAKNPKIRLADRHFDYEASLNLNGQREDYMDGSVSRGLRLTVRLLPVHDHDTLVTKMEHNLIKSHFLDDPIRRIVGSTVQRMRRDTSLNARDEAEQRRDPMDFTGDAVPPDSPPLAWVRLWGGTYVNIFGEYIPEPLKQWGHVMWDAQRWAELGAEHLVSKQWETASNIIEEIEDHYGWRPSGADYEDARSEPEPEPEE